MKKIPTIANEAFMLHGKTAKHLYEKYAKDQPIIDYHCHLEPKMIAEDYKFTSMTDLMLGGDHYKWRLMRSFGIDEEYITGNADPREKFIKYAEALSNSPGNPLYHWTALELKFYFGIDDALTAETAGEIYDKTLPMFGKDGYTARGFVNRSNVDVICTTDDPADDLEYHKAIKATDFKTRVFPAFRPDKCVNIHKATFIPYIEKTGVKSYGELKTWLTSRIDYFDSMGSKVSDHGLDFIPYKVTDKIDLEKVFAKALDGQALTNDEINAYIYDMLIFFAKEYSKKNWVMQIHVGAIRNNNTAMYNKLGPDTGYDSIADTRLAQPLVTMFDELDSEDMLPKTILYSLNPNDLYILGTLMGCYQKAPVKSKIQLGSAWWFCDQKDGMEAQIKALANLGVLGAFVGMLTDSRSFVSYTRHDYFRRILCNIIGNWIDNGEYPNDEELAGKMISNICYGNAKAYFDFK